MVGHSWGTTDDPPWAGGCQVNLDLLDLEGIGCRIVDKQLDLENPRIWLQGNNGADSRQVQGATGKWGHPVRGDPSCPLPTVLRVTQQAVLLCKTN